MRYGLGLETCLETRVTLSLGLERLSRLGVERFWSRSPVLGLETLPISYLFMSLARSSGSLCCNDCEGFSLRQQHGLVVVVVTVIV